MLLTLPVKSAQIHTSPDKPAAAFLYMPALLPDCLRNPPRHIPSSYYKVVVFIDPLQGLYAILLEILWIVFTFLPLDGS